ncbi:MAG: HupE/UreJ family protein [Chromatiaceae bacterium]
MNSKRQCGPIRITAIGWSAVVMLCGLLLIAPLQAHESQPGLLEITQLASDRYAISWRAPIYYGKPHPAELALPNHWQAMAEPTVRRLDDSFLHRQIVSVPIETFNGSLIRFPGLEATITDVFVRLLRLDGSEVNLVVRPTSPEVELHGERPWHVASREFVLLGFEHILLGIDHLLFVLGLLIIVRGIPMLVKTITAFTVAHSITLAVAVLGLATLPRPPVEAAIALSILFLGPEIVRVWRGQTSLTIRQPWVVAFGFGLLHGFGFASGLSTVGMPAAEVPLALLMFNVGVELGQLVFVFLALLTFAALKTVFAALPRWVSYLPGYVVGSFGAFWTLQRTIAML